MVIVPSNAGQHQGDSNTGSVQDFLQQAHFFSPQLRKPLNLQLLLTSVFKNNIFFNVKIQFRYNFELREHRLKNYDSARMLDEILVTLSSRFIPQKHPRKSS